MLAGRASRVTTANQATQVSLGAGSVGQRHVDAGGAVEQGEVVAGDGEVEVGAVVGLDEPSTQSELAV